MIDILAKGNECTINNGHYYFNSFKDDVQGVLSCPSKQFIDALQFSIVKWLIANNGHAVNLPLRTFRHCYTGNLAICNLETYQDT